MRGSLTMCQVCYVRDFFGDFVRFKKIALVAVIFVVSRVHAQVGAQCEPPPARIIEPYVIAEIFPDVIYKVPGRDSAAEQLFRPIKKIAEPLAILGTYCLAAHGFLHVKSERDFSNRNCDDFSSWIDLLVREDALYFDRRKHESSSVSFYTGALSGNHTIRSLAFYIKSLRDKHLINLNSNRATDAWLSRRAAEYDVLPKKKLTAASAQNIALTSVLAKLGVAITVNDAATALADAERLYMLYLDTAREDGSFPAETRRGVSALKYTNMAISELIQIAEFAGEYGVDLYGYKSDKGVDIHLSVGFLLNSLFDDSKIGDYAQENFAPTNMNAGTGQYLGFLRNGFNWVRIYLRRFPTNDNAVLIKSILQMNDINLTGYFDEGTASVAGCSW